MNKDELRLKLQALVDNELDESEIPKVLSEIEASYEMREEYTALLRLRRRLGGSHLPEPEREWFEQMSRRVSKRLFSWAGNLLFIGSYALLLAFSLFSIISRPSISLWIKAGAAGLSIGFVVLLLKALTDRIKESRTDKYKGVMK